jgi:hypothetical protein
LAEFSASILTIRGDQILGDGGETPHRSAKGRFQMLVNVRDWSRILHNCIFSDADQSLCARAWQYREESVLWALWVMIFTPGHCERSFRHHRKMLRLKARSSAGSGG